MHDIGEGRLRHEHCTPRAPGMKPIVLPALVLAVAHAFAVQPTQRLTLELEDYAPVPITGELNGQNTRGDSWPGSTSCATSRTAGDSS
jgi:hypothetical protein